jgi:hypothetical protein
MTADEYAKHVSYALHDLPWRQRRDLVAELREHLAELPPDTDLVARLGTPDAYAAEMRAAAGLERRRGPIAFVRTHRPRTLVLTVLVLTVIGLGIGTLVWVSRYQPLENGGWGTTLGAHDSPAGDGIYYVFREGKPFRYGFSIQNSGPFTVRVVAVPIDFDLTVKYRLFMWPKSMKVGFGPAQPPFPRFEPFDLKPGEERGIVLRGVFSEPCSLRDAGTIIGWTEIPIRFSFLGRTKTASIPLAERTVAFNFTKASECPKARR